MDFILKKKKHVFYSLLNNKGLGASRVTHLQNIIGLNSRKNPKALLKQKVRLIHKSTHKLLLNKSYTKTWYQNRSFNSTLKTCNSIRNKSGFPVRGQRTRTNAKTKKKFKF